MNHPPLIRILIPCFGAVLIGPLGADSLTVGPLDPSLGVSVDLGIEMENTSSVVGMQFDLVYPPDQSSPRAAVSATETDHLVASRDLGSRRRVVVHSPSNAALPSALVLNIPVDLNASSPEGGPSLIVEDLVFTNADGQLIASSVSYHPLEAWRQQYFTTEEMADPTIIADDADPDQDGILNIFEFLFASDPTRRDSESMLSSSLRPATQTPENPATFGFTYRLPRDASGARLYLESTHSLGGWMRESVTSRMVESDATTITYRLEVAIDPENKKAFYRLGAERNPEAEAVEVEPLVTAP